MGGKQLDTLVVDDEPDLRELIDDSFRLAAETNILIPKPNLIMVEDGHQALREVRRYRFDVVVSDYRLPRELTGLQWMAQAKDALGNAIRILLTAEKHPVLKRLTKQAGAFYLEKTHHAIIRLPYTAARLLGYTSDRKQAL